MIRNIVFLTLTGMLALSSCTNQESSEAPKTSAEESATAQPAGVPHATVQLKDGRQVPGAIVASSKTDMVVAGDDGIERKIPMAQIKSVVYDEARSESPRRQAAREPTSSKQQTAQQTAPAPTPRPTATTGTYELPVGSEVSVRTNEEIDSETAKEGQTFDVQITRDVNDADGEVVIPRGSEAFIVIKSASKGGRIRGASDLVLDLESVVIDGKQYRLDTADISEQGKSGVGANKRTAEHVGGGAALGATIGAIAGGGKGAAIGAGAGAGAGVLTQVLTRGGSIKVPAESVLTFRLDKALNVTALQ
jgi:hypothetical protein